jgi:hypothetical protein
MLVGVLAALGGLLMGCGAAEEPEGGTVTQRWALARPSPSQESVRLYFATFPSHSPVRASVELSAQALTVTLHVPSVMSENAVGAALEIKCVEVPLGERADGRPVLDGAENDPHAIPTSSVLPVDVRGVPCSPVPVAFKGSLRAT